MERSKAMFGLKELVTIGLTLLHIALWVAFFILLLNEVGKVIERWAQKHPRGG